LGVCITTILGELQHPCISIERWADANIRPAHLVTVTEPLPETASTAAEPVPFFLDIGSNKPPCAKRAETFEVSGYAVTYTCHAPGAFIVGELDTSGRTWVAQYITTDTQSTQVTYGPEAGTMYRT